MILLNFESYENGLGNNAVLIAKYAEDISRKLNVSILLAPQFFDLSEVTRSVNIPVYAQHVDNLEGERFTGKVIPKNAFRIGCKGTILDSTKLSYDELVSTVEKCKDVGLKVIIRSTSLHQMEMMKTLLPDYHLFHPSEADENKFRIQTDGRALLEQSLAVGGKNMLWCGGIETEKDIEGIIRFGVAGVVLSWQVILSRNPRKVIHDFASKFI